MNVFPDETPHVRYFRTGNGVAELGESTAGTSALPEDAVEITAAEYEQALAELAAAHEAYVEGLAAADHERTRGDYEALIAAGIPEATARRLSGYVGEG